jgi:peptidoglycan/LPS O-acetylase OafA/YrhL
MMEGSRFVALDSWRGICAVLVVLFHFASVLPSALDGAAFIHNAYLFVDFFFVLSGFVLCHGYRNRIAGARDAWHFAVRRFARVWPLHAVVLALFVLAIAVVSRYPHPEGLALTWDGNNYALDAVLPSLLLLNAAGLQGEVWNGPAWSIGAEFYVYILFAFVLLTAPRRLVPLSLALSLSALALVWWVAPDLMNTTWDYGMIRCVAGFFAGVAAYHGHERLRRAGLKRATCYEFGAIALVGLFVVAAGNGPDNVRALSLAAPLVFGLAVVVFAGEGGVLSLILRTRPFAALGRYSFSIYMIHQPLLILLGYGIWLRGLPADSAWAAYRPAASPDLLMIDFVLAVILIAAASHRFIERPAREGINALAPRAASGLAAFGGLFVGSLPRGALAWVSVSARRGRSRA